MPPESAGPLRLGWIGTGVMGAPMCGHLLAGGHQVTVHTRTRGKAADLIAAGATWADTPSEVADASDVVFTMVGSPDDVRATIGELLGTLHPGGIIVDMTTSSPSLARELAAQARAASVGLIDAPVTGGEAGAIGATLSIMVGGDPDAIDIVTPILRLLGARIVIHGGPGAGQHAKAVNQILMASNMLGLAEALHYAERAGLDLTRVLDSVSAGAAGSAAVTNLGPRIVAGDYAPGFAIRHFAKDLRIIADERSRMGLDPVVSGEALAVYERCEQTGLGQLGIQGVIEQLRADSPAPDPVDTVAGEPRP
jgi:3-hydroxyisobutyrate dehydrogenase